MEAKVTIPPKGVSNQPVSSTPQPALSVSQPASVHSSWDSGTQNEPGPPPSVTLAPEIRAQTIPPSSAAIAPSLGQTALASPADQLDDNPAQTNASMQIEGSLASKDPTRTGTDVAPVKRRAPQKLEMLREQRVVAGASVSLANAKSDYLHGLARDTRSHALGFLLRLEQQEREMRLRVAMSVLNSRDSTPANRVSAESWVNRIFFSSHPSDNFTRLLARCNAELDAAPAQSTHDPSLDHVFATPPFPPSDSFEEQGTE